MAELDVTDGKTDTGLRRVGLIGLAFDENSSFMRGAAEAPPLIREALFSDAGNMWSEKSLDLGRAGLLVDAGDVAPSSPGAAPAEIERAVSSLLARGLAPLALGGDHSVTHPVLRALAKKYERLSVLHVDAHPDLYDELLGNRNSHACPFARVMEEGLAERLVQVGIRTMNGHQREQAARFRAEVHEMKDWRGTPALDFRTPVYISIDIDGLDPAYAPGVSHREPGGLSTREVIDLVHAVGADVVGADVVEFNPRMDASGVTAAVCAKLVKELAAEMLGGGGRSVSSHNS